MSEYAGLLEDLALTAAFDPSKHPRNKPSGRDSQESPDDGGKFTKKEGSQSKATDEKRKDAKSEQVTPEQQAAQDASAQRAEAAIEKALGSKPKVEYTLLGENDSATARLTTEGAIAISPYTAEKTQTGAIVHEYGHYVDSRLIGTPDEWGTAKTENDPLFQVMKNSPTMKAVRNDEFVVLKGDTQTRNYMLQGREMFARAFNQYVAQKSGDPVLLAEVKYLQGDNLLRFQVWPDDEFVPIAAELEKVLKKGKVVASGFVASGYAGLLEEMENAAAFEQPQTHTGTGVVLEKRERSEPGFVAAAANDLNDRVAAGWAKALPLEERLAAKYEQAGRALARRARRRYERAQPITAAFDELKHPRHPAGSKDGGEFAPKKDLWGVVAAGKVSGHEVKTQQSNQASPERHRVLVDGAWVGSVEKRVGSRWAGHLKGDPTPPPGSYGAVLVITTKRAEAARQVARVSLGLVPEEPKRFNEDYTVTPEWERWATSLSASGYDEVKHPRNKPSEGMTAAARPPNWLPELDELVTPEDAAAAAARTQAQRRAIVQAMVGSILGIEASQDAVFRALIEAQAGRQAERLVEGSRDAVARVILDAQVEGWGVPQTAEAIQTELEVVSRWQSVMLARTDLISLSNASSVASASLLGDDAPPFKVWLATSDEKTRPAHGDEGADGQTVPIDQSFTVGGESLAYPGDPNGSDGNTINCRCTVRYAWEPNPGFAPNAISAAFSPSQPRYQVGVREGGRWRPESGEGTLDDLAARHPDVEVWASDHGDGITLHMIRTRPGTRGTGAASRALRDLTAMADRRGVPMWLTPEAIGDDAPMSTDQLARWYRRHGWRDTSSRKMGDLEHTGLMIREPARRDPAVTAATVTEEEEDVIELDSVTAASFTREQRDRLASEGVAMSDGAFPVRNLSDLKNAIQALGRAKDEAAARRHVVKRARALRLTGQLPEAWGITADGEPEGLSEAVTASTEPGFPTTMVPPDPNFVDAVLAGMTASAPVAPPEEWFDDPQLPEPTPLTVTPEGRVFGHLAQWGRCHTGIGGRCVIAPRSQTGYEAFHTGSVLTDSGKQVRIGKITARGPHADLNMSGMQAASHYDHSAMSAAYVRAGEDEHGPWLAGAVRSDATPEQIAELRAHPPSGDWRQVGPGGALELVAALAVPVPGFPVAAIAASGAHEGEVTALIMGFDDRQPLALAASCGCDELEQLLEDGALAGLPEREVRMRTLRAV